MTDTNDASEAARALIAQRWGNQKPVRLAEELLPRARELPDSLRSALHQATEPRVGDFGE
jgi:hypothetical protein